MSQVELSLGLDLVLNQDPHSRRSSQHTVGVKIEVETHYYKHNTFLRPIHPLKLAHVWKIITTWLLKDEWILIDTKVAQKPYVENTLL